MHLVIFALEYTVAGLSIDEITVLKTILQYLSFTCS